MSRELWGTGKIARFVGSYSQRMLYGRDAELGRIAEVVQGARRGTGGALVVRGSAGTGKSALLAEAVGAAADATVLRTRGVEAEAPLAFAALQRLLRPLRRLIERLPEPQAGALRAAFGQEIGAPPDRFLVFLGALSLLAEAAEDHPVVAVVDDAHWLDEASAAALLFVARRLDQERVALLFAARDEDARRFEAEDLPEVSLTGLDLTAARQVIQQAVGGDVGAEVSAQLLASTGGNPLALLELPHLLAPDQLTGRAALPGRLPVTETLQRIFLDRANRLSEPARQLLLVAAADDSARIAIIAAASASLGAEADALEEVERSGLVSVTDGVLEFRHPLVRSACYAAATAAGRSAAHAALAAQLTAIEDGDRRAWHRAAAATRPDPEVVAELVGAARRAQQRGGHEAAAAAWQRAAELCPDPVPHAEYRYAAAASTWVAGRVDEARRAADTARVAAADPRLAADAAQLRARIEWNTGSTQLAHRMLLEAAAAVAATDPGRARRLAMFAAAVSTVGGRSGIEIDPRRFALALSDDSPDRGRCMTELITGLARVTDGDIAGAAPSLRAALQAGETAGIDDYDVLPNLGIAALHLGDLHTVAAIHERMLTHAQQDGVLMTVLYALTRLVFSDVAHGAWSTAVARQTEALKLGAATGQPILAGMPRASLLLLSALRSEPGFEDRLAELQPVLDGPPIGVLDGLLRDLVRWAQGLHAFPRSPAGFHHLAQLSLDIVRRQAGLDRIEAAVHAEQFDLARLWVEDLERFGTSTGEAWATAVAAHGRAMMAADQDADTHFEAALQRHGDGGRVFDRARTQFAYGEHLRRTRRRVAARAHLRDALHTFEDLKAGPWIERATTELRASGESIRRREVGPSIDLTPQELQVAQLVQHGLSNRDVAAQLFVSPRTVDFHLRNVFSKTGVTSRTELAQLTLG